MYNKVGRYQKVGTFGRGMTRRFHKNILAIKRLAARDFEDLRQINGCTFHSHRLKICP